MHGCACRAVVSRGPGGDLLPCGALNLSQLVQGAVAMLLLLSLDWQEWICRGALRAWRTCSQRRVVSGAGGLPARLPAPATGNTNCTLA
jgi:hypothetical protein